MVYIGVWCACMSSVVQNADTKRLGAVSLADVPRAVELLRAWNVCKRRHERMAPICDDHELHQHSRQVKVCHWI